MAGDSFLDAMGPRPVEDEQFSFPVYDQPADPFAEAVASEDAALATQPIGTEQELGDILAPVAPEESLGMEPPESEGLSLVAPEAQPLEDPFAPPNMSTMGEPGQVTSELPQPQYTADPFEQPAPAPVAEEPSLYSQGVDKVGEVVQNAQNYDAAMRGEDVKSGNLSAAAQGEYVPLATREQINAMSEREFAEYSVAEASHRKQFATDKKAAERAEIQSRQARADEMMAIAREDSARQQKESIARQKELASQDISNASSWSKLHPVQKAAGFLMSFLGGLRQADHGTNIGVDMLNAHLNEMTSADRAQVEREIKAEAANRGVIMDELATKKAANNEMFARSQASLGMLSEQVKEFMNGVDPDGVTAARGREALDMFDKRAADEAEAKRQQDFKESMQEQASKDRRYSTWATRQTAKDRLKQEKDFREDDIKRAKQLREDQKKAMAAAELERVTEGRPEGLSEKEARGLLVQGVETEDGQHIYGTTPTTASNLSADIAQTNSNVSMMDEMIELWDNASVIDRKNPHSDVRAKLRSLGGLSGLGLSKGMGMGAFDEGTKQMIGIIQGDPTALVQNAGSSMRTYRDSIKTIMNDKLFVLNPRFNKSKLKYNATPKAADSGLSPGNLFKATLNPKSELNVDAQMKAMEDIRSLSDDDASLALFDGNPSPAFNSKVTELVEKAKARVAKEEPERSREFNASANKLLNRINDEKLYPGESEEEVKLIRHYKGNPPESSHPSPGQIAQRNHYNEKRKTHEESLNRYYEEK